jgi:uncharacterized damage-inducible protein DinB
MNKQMLQPMWDMMRQRTGILLRCVEAIPADQIDARPIANMRSVKELVVHTAGFMSAVPGAVVKGEMGDFDEKAMAAGITNKEQLVAFVKNCWATADRTTGQVTDAQLAGMVKTPWGSPFPGFVMYTIVVDEFIHHRGQLYAYLRAMGVEPPMVWSFEANAAGFQPGAHAAS